MSGKFLSTVVIAYLLPSVIMAQTISVDMDTASGIQERITATDSAQSLMIPLRITGAADLYSYQFKVAFDTAKFTFLGAQQDFGIIGEKNILSKNGGTIIGIFQLQTNPPASDTVEFSCSITGTDGTKSVSGDGLVGLLYLKSKITSGDSTSLSVSHGFFASYGDSTLTPVAAYAGGMYKVEIPVSVNRSDREKSGSLPIADAFARQVAVVIGTSEVHFAVPADRYSSGGTLTASLFSLDGRLQDSRKVPLHADNRHVSVIRLGTRTDYTSGTYVCTVLTGTTGFSRTIRLQ